MPGYVLHEDGHQRACAHMHAAKPTPICHCNVRLANVLWDPQPFLADLEMAHFSPWQIIV